MGNFFNLDRIFDIFNYIFWFLLLNIFFMLLNLPAVLFFIFLGINGIFSYLPLFLICLIPVGPSFTALLYCMGKLIRNGDLKIISDFITGLKINFVQSTYLWLLELMFLFILYSNIKFFFITKYSLIIICLFASLIIITLLITPFIYLLISRFSMKNIDVIKGSFILMFSSPLIAISNILVLIVSLILFEITPGTVVLFISSIIAFLLAFINKTLLLNLETTCSNQRFTEKIPEKL